MTENWYLVLELEFDPNPVEDEEIIKERIEEKKKFWSSKSNDFAKGSEYKRYLDYATKGVIKKEMLGDEEKGISNIRAELIKDACEQVYGPIDKSLKCLGKESAEVSSRAIEKMAKRQKVDVELIKKRVAALGMKVVASKDEDYEATYDKFYKKKPPKADTYDDAKRMLDSFHVKDLYEFLYQGIPIKNAENLSCSALLQRSSEKKKKDFYKTDSISATGEKLCGKCDKAFENEASKKAYDDYLAYIRRKEVLDGVKEYYEISEELSPDNVADFIGRLTEVFKNRDTATKVFTAFCKIEKIPIPGENDLTQKNPNIKTCRCGCSNDISERKNCAYCGLDLQIKCPKCGELSDNNIDVCKCGFKFENFDKAVSRIDLASWAIDKMEFDVADVHLADAEKYWPGSDRAKEQRERLSEMKSKVGTAAEEMHKAYEAKNYYEARKQFDKVKKFFPEYSDKDLEEEIKTAITEAEKHKKLAEAAESESDIIEECSKAFEACKDFPGVREIVSKYPPEAPTDLKIVADTKAKVNVLS